MKSVWQSVKAAQGHPRGGEGPKNEGAQAGTVFAVDPSKPDQCAVKWDTDGVVSVEQNDQLQDLS